MSTMDNSPHLTIPPKVANYTRLLIFQLDRYGAVQRMAFTEETAQLWRGRMYNAARHVGFVIQTHWDGKMVTARLMGWTD